MRILYFLVSIILLGFLILILDTRLLLPVPMGQLFSPQHGFWQNAENKDPGLSGEMKLQGLKGKVNIYFDERLVPHVFADHEDDLWFMQGYLHARFRLWQMELQTLSAAGRAAEVVGEIALEHDREFRRLGMVFSAENSLRAMEANDTTKRQCDAYTAGVNSYISTLTESALPLEYKLLGYKPEKWSNLKSALFLKYMSYDLSGFERDFEMTNARSHFSAEDFGLLFPERADSCDPVIPADSGYRSASMSLSKPEYSDSLYFKPAPVKVEQVSKPDPANGSNNWAVSGRLTQSGFPILCNDPHLVMNLPSLWYEMQLHTRSFNAYGATFPGAPGMIIGFNDSCAFGFTNAGRDVRDYYEIVFRDDSRKQYLFEGSWMPASFRIEEIRVKGKPVFYDTVVYTHLGPVMYDHNFGGKRTGNKKSYAVRWKAHDGSNELMFFNRLYRSRNFSDYYAALENLKTPGQNVVFASHGGDIALGVQAEFPAKWKGQGDYVMPGTDSGYLWQGMIPRAENPYQFNPARGFVSSANQFPADTGYPYYQGYDYPIIRGNYINRRLSSMQGITVGDMMALQADNYNLFGEKAMSLIREKMDASGLNENEKNYFKIMRLWDHRNEADSKAATIFEVFWNNLLNAVFKDEMAGAPQPVLMPKQITLLDAIRRDSSYKFIDNINTPEKESLAQIMKMAFRSAAAELKNLEKENRLTWAAYQQTRVQHLLKLPAFSSGLLYTGGGANCINATRTTHGPSWKMLVHLTAEPEAYGIYPGGQSGNPGSRYYDAFIDRWTQGKYFRLWKMKKGDEKNEKIRWSMKALPA